MHLPICRLESPDIPLPADRRPMAGRHAVPITSGSKTHLFWPSSDSRELSKHQATDARQDPVDICLTLTCAIDDREFRELEILNPESGECYATITLPFAAPGQIYRCQLTSNQYKKALQDGVALRLKSGDSPFWIVAPGGINTPDSILPNLSHVEGSASLERFLSVFCTPASFQQWDWTGICVLDGLQDWAKLGNPKAIETLEQYLETFMSPTTGQRENFRSQPNDDQSAGPESGGPYAILATQCPTHPRLSLATEGFQANVNPFFQCVASSHLVTESNYNVAYPMMSLAVFTDQIEWRERSIHQLDQTQKYLASDQTIWLRYNPTTEKHHFKNWSRG